MEAMDGDVQNDCGLSTSSKTKTSAKKKKKKIIVILYQHELF